jgi:hypothetical protein
MLSRRVAAVAAAAGGEPFDGEAREKNDGADCKRD